jgi:hypothetical protein
MDQYSKPVFVNFANINMTFDAFLVVLSGIFLFLFLTFSYGFQNLYLVILLVYGTMAYKINCMHVGSCHFYAKYLSIATVVNIIIIVLNNKNFNLSNLAKINQ